jgi:hypothetical protein
MDAILFILFVLNHSRNPTILLGLFLDLKKQDSIVGEQTRRAVNKAQADPDSESAEDHDFQGNINRTLAAYQAKRQVNKTAFINICRHVFANGDTMSHISNFLTACDMMPSFVGVVMFCARHIQGINTSLVFNSPRFNVNIRPLLEHFNIKIDGFQAEIGRNTTLFAREGVDPTPTTPLDHLVNACYHLKSCLLRVKTLDRMLLDACCLFPSCFYEEDIFSQFGPCAAYGNGVLEDPGFQAALGCVATAKTMCARMIVIGKLEVTPSKHSPADQTAALGLFLDFFDKGDQSILQKCSQPESATSTTASTFLPPHMLTSPQGVKSGPAPQQTDIVEETKIKIQSAIHIFGMNPNTDANNFINIFIGMSWENHIVPVGIVPEPTATRKYIQELLSNEESSQVLAINIARYLNQNGSNYSVGGLMSWLLENVFPILLRRLHQQFDTRKSDNEPRKPESSPPPAGNRRQRPTGDGDDDSGLREGRDAEIIGRSSLAAYRITERRSSATDKIILFVKELTGLGEIVEDTQDSVDSGCDGYQCMQGIQQALSVFTESDHSLSDMRLLLRTVIELLREDVENAHSDYEYTSSYIADVIIRTFGGFTKKLNKKKIDSLRDLIQRKHPHQLTSESDFDGGSSRHTKRPHRDTRRRKQKNKSRRKTQNKCNTKKSRKY